MQRAGASRAAGMIDKNYSPAPTRKRAMSALGRVSSQFSCCDWQTDYRPYPGSTAPSDLPRLNRQPEFRPARVQSFKCAFAFKARELMAKAEMDPCAKSNVAVRPSLEIKLLGEHVGRRIHVC